MDQVKDVRVVNVLDGLKVDGGKKGLKVVLSSKEISRLGRWLRGWGFCIGDAKGGNEGNEGNEEYDLVCDGLNYKMREHEFCEEHGLSEESYFELLGVLMLFRGAFRGNVSGLSQGGIMELSQ